MNKDKDILEKNDGKIIPLSDLTQEGNRNLLSIKTANQWIKEAKEREEPQKLYEILWYESEICILFADANVGKSVLAVQIANHISKNQPVIYADFELTSKQFEGRYSNKYTNHYIFPDNFLRVEIDADAEIDDDISFENQLIESLEDHVIDKNAKVIIIDNITYIGTETEKSRNALPLMKKLKLLKRKHNLSLLLLAHTPKRDMSKPITRNDLAGSKALINFCDSAFTIGESFHDSRLRYVKQIKSRESEIIYDTNNVMLFEICKPDNFLLFEFVGYAKEMAHLKTLSDKARDEMESTVLERINSGDTYREIANDLGISHMSVKRILDKSKNKDNE